MTHYDVIHAHWLIPQGLVCSILRLIMRKKMAPVLCTMHGSDLVAMRNYLMLKMKSHVISKMSRVTVVSNSLIPYVEELKYSRDKIDVCPMGIDLIHTFKNADNVLSRPENLIFVGRLINEKGIIDLIEAVRMVKKEYPDIHLDVVGDGPLRKDLETRIFDYGLDNNVVIHGAVENKKLPEFYSKAGIAIIPSTVNEGFGLVIVEAMGCHCVVLASKTDSFKEIITDGLNGVLVEPNNPQNLAKEIINLLKNKELYEELSNNSRSHVLGLYDWNITAKKYREIFNSMLI